jgi:prephenate dehydrogenase
MEANPAIGVVGAGLIGGSIALAASEKGCPVALYDLNPPSEDVVPAAIALMPDLNSLSACSQLIFLATPLDVLTAVAKELSKTLRPGVIVSDVASVKGSLARTLARAFAGLADYVPSHPMAGSERSGWAAAHASLFERSTSIVCPEFATAERSVETVETFWEMLGARSLRMSVAEHDRAVAAVSHLPHALAAVLSAFIGETVPEALAVAGPGFRSVTRIAAGSPPLWVDILLSNRQALAEHLRHYQAGLERLTRALEAGDRKYLQGLLDVAKRNRDTLDL